MFCGSGVLFRSRWALLACLVSVSVMRDSFHNRSGGSVVGVGVGLIFGCALHSGLAECLRPA